jgi:hypothetical protein
MGTILALTTPTPLLEQSGQVPVHGTGAYQVYYPYPYKTTPHLSVGHWYTKAEIVDQQPDRFSVLVSYFSDIDQVVSWTAEGIPLHDPRPFWETMPGWGWTCFLGVLAGAAAVLLSFLDLPALRRPVGDSATDAEAPAPTGPSADLGEPVRRLWASLRK